MKYLIVYEKTATGYSAYLPDLPGCIATGRSKKEVEKNIRQAIELHLQGMREDGQTPDPPNSFAEYKDVSFG